MKWIYALGIGAVTAGCTAATAPESKVTEYESFPDKYGKPLAGELLLSETKATFSELNGTMQLQRVGAFSTGGDTETTGAAVFKIINADTFAEDNPKGERFLQSGEALHWLSVRHGRVGETAQDWIRVCALTVTNWRDYTPEKPGLAWCVSFAEKEEAR